jgi:LmbE family N-acetylglucosaminyl deacetylase
MPGLLALVAHPDDEFFCGGLLAALASRNVPVHLAYWTRGEGAGSPRRRTFWNCFPQSWRPRVREAQKVASLLPATSLSFLGAVDPVPDPDLRAPSDPTSVVLEKLSRLLTLHEPEMMVTHGSDGEYGHPAHRRLNQIAREFSTQNSSCPLISFGAALNPPPPVRYLNQSDPADFILDTLSYEQKKRDIVLAHQSQTGVLESLADGTLDGLLRLSRYEGYRYWSAMDPTLYKLRRWTGQV